ncbi:thermonuclease family protein [Agrobacterium tumefaciens]|uniref:thermonuclease family protein n=1 Tax=Agrobacterium tumefaciens TaxID=358 RepID=UPI0021D1D708|nr:thermonuclease family protein [Agrobacterium tumefaciens]UXS05577.1 thermonuclease family protein [Agrobacterium tumefaciens]
MCAVISLSILVGQSSTSIAANSFSIPGQGVEVLTGDSWLQSRYVVRLYGVQSCLRGKQYTDRAGSKQDCGAVSAAFLAALVRDTNPVCRSVGSLAPSATLQTATVLAICTVRLGGQSLDLGAMMIAQGFAFAALANNGKPVYMPYLIQESIAQQSAAGLWAFSDVPHPSRDLLAIQE